MNYTAQDALQQTYDAVVVGSGATGGWAAKELTEAGLRVALLEAGPKGTPPDFTQHQQTWQLPYLRHSPLMRRPRPTPSLVHAPRQHHHQWFVHHPPKPP